MSVAESIDTRSAAGRLVLNVLASVSQWEREACGERTKDALRQIKAEGVQLGGEALGWERTEHLDAQGRKVVRRVEEEVEVVERILALKAEGLSNRAVARDLEAAGYRTKRGGKWTHVQVGAVLRRSQGGVA